MKLLQSIINLFKKCNFTKSYSFQPGPIQRAWLSTLKNHPEKQHRWLLAKLTVDGNDYQACCLGELLLEYHRQVSQIQDVTKLFNNTDKLISNGINDSSDRVVCNPQISLYTFSGGFGDPNTGDPTTINGFNSLAEMNDEGYTWPEIARTVENNIKKVFKYAQ